MGVWIETKITNKFRYVKTVTPHVGVWIETKFTDDEIKDCASLPMWEGGLKRAVLAKII